MNATYLKRGSPLVRALGMLLMLLSAAVAHGQTSYDRWYRIEIDSQPSGTMHQTRTISANEATSVSVIDMAVKRGPTSVRITLESEFIETLEGQPVRMKLVQGLGTEPTTIIHEFRADTVLETVEGPAGTQRRIIPRPDQDFLTPVRAERALLDALRAGHSALTTPVLDPLSGIEPVLLIVSDIQPATVDRLGEVVDGWTMTSRTSETAEAPPSFESLAFDGTPVLIEQPLGELHVVMRLVPAEGAADALEPVELLVRTFVTPDRPIRRARRSTYGVYRLSIPDGQLPDLPSTASQTFERQDAASGTVTVDLRTAPPPAGEVDTTMLLAATPMADAADPEIVAFVERTLAGLQDASPAVRAERLRRAVHDHVSAKNLSSGFGSASETVRTRTGDCTEHAVLLAACLRAAGIPSRVASGLIYADRFAGEREVFAFHMWTQGLIESESGFVWNDLDATLPGSVAFDATHITLGLDPLAKSLGVGAFGASTNLIGAVELRVETIK